MSPWVLLGFALVAADTEAADLTGLRAVLEAELADSKIRGAAIRVWTRDEEVAIDWGQSDAEGQVPVSPTTRFRAGSVAKLVTSLLVLRAEAAGRLTVDDPIDRYVDGAFDDGRVTIAQLLEHTSGLRGSTYSEYADGSGGTTPAQYIETWGPFTPRWPPGLHYSYANGGHTLAARAVEMAWSDSFDELAAREVFAPLAMESASFDAEPSGGLSVSVSFDREGERVQPRWRMPFRPSGALVATADDLVRLTRMLIDRGALSEGGTFLPRSSIERMERAETGLAARAGAARGAYGLGSFTWVASGTPLRGHWGRVEGFLTSVGYHAESGVGVVLTVNTGDRRGMERLRRRVGEQLAPIVTERESPPPTPTGEPAPLPDDLDLSGAFVLATHAMPLRAWLFELFQARKLERVDGLDRIAVEPVWPSSGQRQEWVRVGPALYRPASGRVPTATLTLVDGERFWIDGDSFRGISSWRLHATRVVLASALVVTPWAIFMLGWDGRASRRLGARGREAGVRRGWWFALGSSLCLWALFVLFVRFGLLGELGDAGALGRVGMISLTLMALSLAVPLLGAAALLAPGRHTIRLPGLCMAALSLLMASLILASHGWLPLRTWVGG